MNSKCKYYTNDFEVVKVLNNNICECLYDSEKNEHGTIRVAFEVLNTKQFKILDKCKFEKQYHLFNAVQISNINNKLKVISAILSNNNYTSCKDIEEFSTLTRDQIYVLLVEMIKNKSIISASEYGLSMYSVKEDIADKIYTLGVEL